MLPRNVEGISIKGLYSAVINGNVTEVQKLLDAGATANATSYNNNWSPLHLAAFLNRTDIIEILIKGKGDVDLLDTDGDTPLHLALLQGHLHAAEVLRQYGASLETKNIKGETPEDKGRDELKRRRRKAVYWRNSVPTEIEQMKDEDSVPLYLQLLESGSEKKRDIRLVVVGKKGAGKTSLIKNLFGENGKAAKTNGIEIHRLRCKSDTDDGIWTKLDRKNEELEINARLLKPYGQTLKKQEEGSEIAMSPRLRKNRISLEEISNQTKVASRNSSISAKKIDEEDIFTTNRESEVNVTQHQLPAAAEESETLNTDKFENRQLSNTEDNIWMESQSILQNEQAHKDIESMLNSRVDFDDNEDYASVFLWDFAGDEEFYHTHQTFLSPDAIYLVVTQMNETDKEDTQVMFRLWVDSIHCYCQLQQQNVTMNGINDDQLDPPIVVVGTFKDQVAADDEEQRESKCKNKLQTLARLVPTDALRHIRDKYTHFLSNTEDDDTVFTLLKKEIMEIARTMKGWNQDYPLKFIQLERLLREKKTSLPILSFEEIKKLADSIPKPLNTEELILFLKYHHEIREIVYFEDIPEYIILDTQWLANAFKCIVTAEDFQRQRLQTRDDWIEFNQKGKLSHAVIEDIYTNLKLFSQHKTHILNLMEKFNIIIPCIKSNNSQNPCYYVPCMIKKELKDDIYERFGIIEDRKSLWLCFEFTFLPPHLMNHLVATLHRKYDFSKFSRK
ncbi:unnamed protein product [Mytilus edulis]|uniref:non-specific serine/threonine protein kinase n=1 Tax=Mytilus edulis TaxID=6550 RepID=A0A8S3RED3_MYTED|nr:unnamed protein product [Mytilus edulis]